MQKRRSLALVLPLLAIPLLTVPARGQPKLYTDGHGLAITRIVLQRWTGTGWQKANKYRQNQRYRFRMRFKNFFKAGTPVSGPAYGNTGIHITGIVVTMELGGAKFKKSQRKSVRCFLMRHENFNDTIAPGKSRWFNFGEFIWQGPPAPLSMFRLELYTSHRQIIYMPPAPKARLVPN